MCSLLFLRTNNSFNSVQIEKANFFQKARGPDFTQKIERKDKFGMNLTFLHNLLDISGNFATQPIVRNESVNEEFLMFNGEIYNFDHKFFNSDTEFLSEKLNKNENLFSLNLDGEFAIIHYNMANSKLTVITDPFLTKPLYFGIGSLGDFGVASYASALKTLYFESISQFDPNSYYEIYLGPNQVKINKIGQTFEFSIDQYQDNFDKWEELFINAVKKRALHGNCKPYLNLSSGYDSGAICLALNLLKIPYETFSIRSGESYRVLEERFAINKQGSCDYSYVYEGVPKNEIPSIKNNIKSLVEPFRYLHEDGPGIYNFLQDDGGAIGMYFLAKEAQSKKLRVSLSGAGADEIISDYGFHGERIYFHSEFGGKFPENLEGFFPWKKFYGDTQRSYLFKEEFILGAFAIEGRYPFLDAELVQSYIHLSALTKNSEYKAPVAYFLRKYGYPFEENKKRGFAPEKENIKKRIRSRIVFHINKIFNKGI